MTADESPRVLHLFSDWKWTGPAEPAVDLAATLARRGMDVRFACSPLPFDAEDALEKRARERGLEPLTAFALAKHFNVFQNRRDAAAIARYVDAEGIDILHAHRLQDHWIAAMAARRARRPVRVVRTSHDAVPQRKTIRTRLLYKDRTDLLIDLSREAYQRDGSVFRLNRRLVYIPPAVDADRFDPARVSGDLREELGISREEVVIGIVARIQEHRRFDMLLEAFRRIAHKYKPIRLVIVGRGTHMEKVAVRPARRMKLEDRVIFAGYRREDYRQALKTFDLKMFLVPGSDGSCRAVLQALAMGVPVVATTRGILPEIVHDGVNGFLASPDSIGDLAEGMARLVRDPVLRRRMGAKARHLVLERHTLEAQARRVEREYRRLMEGRPSARPASEEASEALPAG